MIVVDTFQLNPHKADGPALPSSDAPPLLRTHSLSCNHTLQGGASSPGNHGQIGSGLLQGTHTMDAVAQARGRAVQARVAAAFLAGVQKGAVGSAVQLADKRARLHLESMKKEVAIDELHNRRHRRQGAGSGESRSRGRVGWGVVAAGC